MALSDKERDILANLERELANDSKFVNTMTHSSRFNLGTKKQIILGGIALLIGIALLLAGITTQLVALGAVGFLAMVGGVFWAFDGHGNGPVNASGHPPKNTSGFMKNLEDKWEERRNG